MLIIQYKASFTYDRLGRRFSFVYIYACIAVLLCRYCFSVNKDLCRPNCIRKQEREVGPIYSPYKN